MCEILDRVYFLLRWLVSRRIASDLVGFRARQLKENQLDKSASADSNVWRSAEAEDRDWLIRCHQHIDAGKHPGEREAIGATDIVKRSV